MRTRQINPQFAKESGVKRRFPEPIEKLARNCSTCQPLIIANRTRFQKLRKPEFYPLFPMCPIPSINLSWSREGPASILEPNPSRGVTQNKLSSTWTVQNQLLVQCVMWTIVPKRLKKQAQKRLIL